jgi:hypothetical protein
VADVGDEVPAYPGDPVRLGHVGRLDRHVPVAERDRPDVYPERVPSVAPGQVQLHLPAGTRAPGLSGQGTHDGVGDRRASHGRPGAQQPHLPRGRVGQHRPVVRVEHQHTDPQGVEAAPAEAAYPDPLAELGQLAVVAVPGAGRVGRWLRALLTAGGATT